jgi:hypothetical protein
MQSLMHSTSRIEATLGNTLFIATNDTLNERRTEDADD